jgi:hypothetical protein
MEETGEAYAETTRELLSRIQSVYDDLDDPTVEELRETAGDFESNGLDDERIDRVHNLFFDLADSIDDPEPLREKIESYENKIEYRQEKLEHHEEEGNEEKANWNRSELDSLREYLKYYKFFERRMN